jgi:hypothetical protein
MRERFAATARALATGPRSAEAIGEAALRIYQTLAHPALRKGKAA